MCPKSINIKHLLRPCFLAGAFLLAGSQVFALDEATADSARVINNAKAPPIKTVTNFTQALRCMDELFLAFDKRGIVITSGGIPDETGKVRTGTKESPCQEAGPQQMLYVDGLGTHFDACSRTRSACG